jgi:pyruvate dehydrogenase complex dehydrogenase (E1) component
MYEAISQLVYRTGYAAYPHEKVMADTEEIARSIASLGLMPISAILSLSFSLH